MKRNTIKRRKPWMAFFVAASIILGVLAIGIMFSYEKLRAIWIEQCEIRDYATQVSISSGTIVKGEVLAENFGLRTGANLALIDFDAKRQEILKKIPNLKSITVTRHLPARVTITAEERTPVARLNVPKNRIEANNRSKVRTELGKVVDDEGVVFICQRGTSMLPTIRDANTSLVTPGSVITGRARAALNLVLRCREARFLDLGLLEVDLSKPDFLLATLSNYSQLKICWAEMDAETFTPRAQADLDERLRNLQRAIGHNLRNGACIWNITDTPERASVDRKVTLP